MKRDSTPNEPLPPLLSHALHGRRVELDLIGGRAIVGVVTLVLPSKGLLRIKSVSHREPDGSWRGKGEAQLRVRSEILRITVLDLDATDASHFDAQTKWQPAGNPWSPR